MPVYEHQPHDLLAPFIHSFCYIERQFVVPHTTFSILPDSMIEMVWSFGADCSVCFAEYTYPLPACYIVGLLNAPLTLSATGLVQIVRARFYPWGLLPLIRGLLRPASDSKVSGLLWASLDPHVLPQSTLTSSSDNGVYVVRHMQHFLLNQVVAATLHNQDAIQAAQTLLTQNGDIEMRVLAQQLGLSERSLRRTFHTSMHTSPKAFARLVRFEYVRNTLWRAPDTVLADIALEAGYSDQAHMQREFRRFSKRTPRQFVADMRHLRSLLTEQSGRNLQNA